LSTLRRVPSPGRDRSWHVPPEHKPSPKRQDRSFGSCDQTLLVAANRFVSREPKERPRGLAGARELHMPRASSAGASAETYVSERTQFRDLRNLAGNARRYRQGTAGSNDRCCHVAATGKPRSRRDHPADRQLDPKFSVEGRCTCLQEASIIGAPEGCEVEAQEEKVAGVGITIGFASEVCLGRSSSNIR
jgi:hypothetical protein